MFSAGCQRAADHEGERDKVGKAMLNCGVSTDRRSPRRRCWSAEEYCPRPSLPVSVPTNRSTALVACSHYIPRSASSLVTGHGVLYAAETGRVTDQARTRHTRHTTSRQRALLTGTIGTSVARFHRIPADPVVGPCTARTTRHPSAFPSPKTYRELHPTTLNNVTVPGGPRAG